MQEEVPLVGSGPQCAGHACAIMPCPAHRACAVAGHGGRDVIRMAVQEDLVLHP